jgi:hypothetical protein
MNDEITEDEELAELAEAERNALSEFATESIVAAHALTQNTKRLFWCAVLNGAGMKEAADQAGIDDVMIATHLMIQLLEIDYVMGMHYLETNETPGTFTQDRKLKQ